MGIIVDYLKGEREHLSDRGWYDRKDKQAIIAKIDSLNKTIEELSDQVSGFSQEAKDKAKYVNALGKIHALTCSKLTKKEIIEEILKILEKNS